MDDDGLNMRNWGYYERSFKRHLGLQLMSSVIERNTKSLLAGCENAVYEPSGSRPIHMLQQPDTSKDARVAVEDPIVRKEADTGKKRAGAATLKTPKPKKTKKGPSLSKDNGNSSVQHVKPAKKNMEVVINGIDMDISGFPYQFVRALELLSSVIDGAVGDGNQPVAPQPDQCIPCQ
ncbi:unnamed protein product [Ilex paraguariensis]|uniref:GAGA-binding transcriptional activator n=1 Tax=Ilex paraguariensis TaxID=185542 RepID=A0ABC8U4E8_9AQUA